MSSSPNPALGGGYAGIVSLSRAELRQCAQNGELPKARTLRSTQQKESSQLNSDFAFTQRDGKRNARFLRANLWLGFLRARQFPSALGLSRASLVS